MILMIDVCVLRVSVLWDLETDREIDLYIKNIYITLCSAEKWGHIDLWEHEVELMMRDFSFSGELLLYCYFSKHLKIILRKKCDSGIKPDTICSEFSRVIYQWTPLEI